MHQLHIGYPGKISRCNNAVVFIMRKLDADRVKTLPEVFGTDIFRVPP
jgi:hypothetical protein